MEEDGSVGGEIEEGRSSSSVSVRLVDKETRWVDGSEVDSESTQWSLLDEGADHGRDGFLRRRLVKKPKRVDSFDVEAMEIAGAHGHHSKVHTIAQILLNSSHSL